MRIKNLPSIESMDGSQDALVIEQTDGSENKSRKVSPAQIKQYVLGNSIDDIYSVMGQNGAKNLIPYPFYETTKTARGITFTDNGDGTITVDTAGEASTGSATFFCGNPNNVSNLIKLDKNKTYIFSDTTHSGIANNCVVGIRYFAEGVVPSTTSGTNASCNESNNWQVTVTNAVYAYVYIYVYSGKTVSNLTFKPMLRLAADTDNTYQPYAKTNKQLTDELDTAGEQIEDIIPQVTKLLGLIDFVQDLPPDASTTPANIPSGIRACFNVSSQTAGYPLSNALYVSIKVANPRCVQILFENGQTTPAGKYRTVVNNTTWSNWKDF